MTTNDSNAVRATQGMLVPLGEFVATLDPAVLPAEVRRQASLCILDTIGCMVLGAGTEEADTYLAAEAALDPRKEASVFGKRAMLSVEASARVNGYFGDIFELNDLIGGHASIGTVSAILALGEHLGSTGAEVLAATIAGVETTARVHAAFRNDAKPYEDTGNAFIGFMNTLGAAAGSARLLKLDAERTAEALAVAGALAGWCPSEAIFRDGGSIKPVLFGGWPASVGIQGARLAKHGMTGPLRVLEGDLGFFRAVANRRNLDALLGTGGQWHLASPKRKLHACCGFIHSPIDLAVQMRQTHGAAVFKDAAIDVEISDSVYSTVVKPNLPSTANEARFHAPYVLAMAAAGADVILPEHATDCIQHLEDPGVRSLLQRIRITPSTHLEHYYKSTLSVTPPGGAPIKVTCVAPKGSPANPLSESEVIGKFVRIASRGFKKHDIHQYAQRVLRIEEESSCRWLASELG